MRTVIDPDDAEPAQEPGTEAEVDELTRRQLRRQFLSMEKRRKLEGSAEDDAESGEREARLIVKARGGEIAPEPRRAIGAAAGDSVSDGEPEVPRLERRAVRAPRTYEVKLEKAAPPEPKKEDEDHWTDAKKGVSWRWAVIIAGGMAGLVVVALVIVQMLSVIRRDDGVRVQPVTDLEVERIDIGEAKELLEANPAALYDEASEILRAYTEADDASGALALVRRADSERETLMRVWRPWQSLPHFERPELIQYGLMSFENPPSLVVWGLRQDFSPFRAYFVREGGRLRLDWRATEAFCDIPISELPDAGEVERVTVRGVVQAKAFHTAGLPDDEYRSFQLSAPDGDHFVWGYVERAGDLDRKLEDILSRGTGLGETRSKGRVTLVVDSPDWRDLENQFLITEVLHNEWVSP